MLRSVGFLLLLLFSVSSSHDAKELVLAENELRDSSTLTCDGVPSCSRKGDPYKSNGSTIGSEIQSSRLLLMADLDRAASHGVLSPSIPYAQSRPLPSTTILSPAQNMLNNSKLASSANRLTSVFESPSVFSGNLRNKGSNWLLLCTINTPHFCPLSTPHFAVQPLLHPPTHKQFFSKLVLDHMPHLGTPKPSVPPVFLQGVTSKSLIPHAHVHNVLPFKNFHQEANHNGAPYFVIPLSSLTTGKMKHIEAASSPYDSVRSGPSLPLTQDRQSQESLHFGKYTRSVQPSHALPVTAPSLVPMHHGQPQDPSSRRVQAPENRPPVRFLHPSNALPSQALPPIASNGEQTRGPFVNEHQPPRVLPPTLASQGPTMVTSPPLVSSRAQQYQMHPSAFHPVMPNPSNHKIWLSPRVIGTPSQIQSPVEHSRASFSPSGSVSSPHASLPIESPSGHAGTPAFTPSFKGTVSSPTSLPSEPVKEAPSRSVASSPSIFPSEPPQKKPSVPLAAWAKNISKGQAPVAFAPRIQEHVIPPMNPPSKSPIVYSGGSHANHHNMREHVSPPISLPSKSSMGYPGRPHAHRHNMRGSVASSPSIFPSEPPQKKPTVPLAEWPKNISKGQAPIAFAPRIQEHVIPSINPPSKSPMYSGISHVHHHIMRGSVASSPNIFPSEPPQNKPSVPLAARPKNISKGQVPVAFAPSIQEHVTPPISLPSEPSMEYPGRSHAHHHNMRGSVASSPSIFPSEPPQKKPTVPVAEWPKNISKGQAPIAFPPRIQEHVIPSISPPSKSPMYSGRSHVHHHIMRGSVASSPSIFPSEPPQNKPSVPLAARPKNISKGQVPVAFAPSIQEHRIPPISLPSKPPTEYPGRPESAPSIAFHSPKYHRGKNVQGPVTSSPSIFPSVPHQKKPSIPVAAQPRSRLKRQTPGALAPKNQEPVAPSISVPVPSESPIEYPGTPEASPLIRVHSPPNNQHVKGPSASPPSLSPSISHRQKSIVPVANQPGKRSWRRSPAMTAPIMQGHHSPPRNAPSEPPQKNLRIPVAPPPRIRSQWHAPLVIPPRSQGHFSPPPLASPPEHYRRHSGVLPVPPSVTFPTPPYHQRMKGPVSSPFESPKGNTIRPAPAPSKISPRPVAPTPRLFPSGPSQKKPSIPMAAPPSKRSSEHAPVASPPMVEGPVSSPFKSPKGNTIHPAPAPSKISPSTHHYRGMKGPVASTPRLFPSGPSQKKPSIPMTAPPSKISSEHAPVASPPMVEGPVYSPVNHPLLSPSANLRPTAVSPSIRFPSPPHHRHMKGPVASTPRMIPSVPAQKKPSIPMAAPPNKSSLKHTPVASPPMVEGNLRPPAVSPSIRFPSPQHHRRVKGPVYSPAKSPLPSPVQNLRPPAASPSFRFPSPRNHQYAKGPSAPPPNIASSEPPQTTRGIPLAAPPLVFPPPPPARDCSSISCTQPLTSTPPGAPCGCVYPMQVELELGVALYAFFPLVSELAAEIAAGTFLKQSQVRIMGANADSQDQEKTIVMLDLVPLGEKFDNTTAFLIFERFWQKKVIINGTLFGDYWVIFVYYPGLPPPPPSAFSNANIDGEPTNSNGPGKHEPLGVDINKRGKKMGAGIIVVVSLSSAVGAVICVGAVWITVLKCKNRSRPTSAVVEPTIGSSVKRSGVGGGSILSGSMASSTSMSFASSMAPYTGSAKTLTIAELERATDRFNPQNILGEGGFGRVYRGVLEDGTKVAVKVLTRDDQQGGREFIAEVEMLSRLHHRNLVKLIGICTEEHNRSLVYELIPNGSVESHLHGVDKETAPLDWDARIKIALGAARGLAYLHEDSSPRVIHRDFKASNILLEDDFTPKVSDFGLAKSASEEVSGHISTRVMGTFGYVAPEYAMTGHLLVKSDVYSYGVVLLELLTGRKPVDMSQPPGQENLVTWARPLLTSKEGLEALVDPALGNSLPFDNIARVAAIASMCVQPEVSHRPFMGEVVQALKLVYNDSDASNGGGSGSFSHGGESNAHDIEVKDDSSQQWPQSIQYVPDGSSFVTIDYDSGPLRTQGLETERPLSASALLSTSGSLLRQLSGSFRRHSSSGPLRTNKSKKSWYGIRGLAGGSISEHGVQRHEDVHELWP